MTIFCLLLTYFPLTGILCYYNKVAHREVLGVESIERQTLEMNGVKWYILCAMGLGQS